MAFRRKNHLQKEHIWHVPRRKRSFRNHGKNTQKHGGCEMTSGYPPLMLTCSPLNMGLSKSPPTKKTIPFPRIKFSRCEKDDVSFLGADFPMFKKNKHLRVPGRCCCNYTFKASIAGTALLHICTWTKSSWETCGYWILLMVPNHPARKPPFGCTKACK